MISEAKLGWNHLKHVFPSTELQILSNTHFVEGEAVLQGLDADPAFAAPNTFTPLTNLLKLQLLFQQDLRSRRGREEK